MPPVSPATAAVRTLAKRHAANDNGTSGTIDYRIGWLTGGFMLAVAVLFDAIQILLTLLVLPALGSYLVDFLYMIAFPIWFMLVNVELFGGRNAGLKMASAFGGAGIEIVGVVNALPAITASVGGVIIASRMEDRMNHAKQKENPVSRPVRYFPSTTKLPRAANDGAEQIREAA